MNNKLDISLEENIIENGESISYKDFDQSRSIFEVFKNKKDNQYLEVSDEIRIKNLKEFINKSVYKIIYLEIINDKSLSNEEEKTLQEKYPNINIGYSHSWNQDFNYLLLLTNKGIRIPAMLGGLKIDIGFGSGNLDQYIVGGEKGTIHKGNLDFIKDFIKEVGADTKISNKLEKKKIKLSDLLKDF